MKQDNKQNRDKKDRDVTAQKMQCDDIQSVLFDYMTRELGDARSSLVREHLLKCPKCAEAAAEIQATLDLLHKASEAEKAKIPEHLSEKHRKRVIWAFMHPVLNWIYEHHTAVSIAITLIVLAIGSLLMMKIKLWRAEPIDVVPITIQTDTHGTTNQPSDQENGSL